MKNAVSALLSGVVQIIHTLFLSAGNAVAQIVITIIAIQTVKINAVLNTHAIINHVRKEIGV
uniref:Uncharacterized protein n=1 Tax=Marseillevirus LCMAC101 TaxID=2506602 RepID=A0A481YRV1_9VIRU|nr:MAG: hypothetical protein LCMAC101_02520 [Marseillevirus LCMAC101]